MKTSAFINETLVSRSGGAASGDAPRQESARSLNNKVRILSIDGGGMRGVIPATIIWHLEQRLQVKSGNEDARISDYFDLLAGTSTGGILVCAYLAPDRNRPGRPRMTARQALAMYLDNRGCGIFNRSPYRKIRSMMGLLREKYCSKNKGVALQNCLGKHTRLSELIKPCLVTAYNITDRKARFFTRRGAQSQAGENHKVWEVAKASAAAPTFFQPAILPTADGGREVLIDGGVFANNPSLCAFTEAQKIQFAKLSDKTSKATYPRLQDVMIVSLGTGSGKQGYEWDAVKSRGAIGWAKPIVDILINANTETVHGQLQQLFDHQCEEDCGRYYRINPTLAHASDSMDDVRPENLKALHEAALQYIDEHEDQLEKMVDELIAFG